MPSPLLSLGLDNFLGAAAMGLSGEDSRPPSKGHPDRTLALQDCSQFSSAIIFAHGVLIGTTFLVLRLWCVLRVTPAAGFSVMLSSFI